jgi:2'-5' RNA ligase
MPATQTALVVPVPEAEAVVGHHRAVLDVAASWGVPAHVTVLYPFLPPDRITADVRTALRGLVASVARFDVTLARVEWFGDRVVWLAPAPDEPFRALTAAVWARFPETPPYGGEHPDLVPHLTVGHDAPLDVLRRAAADVAGSLPVTARISHVHLISGAQEPRSWRGVETFALGPGTARGRGAGAAECHQR